MTIGPEPTIRILWRSVRLGTRGSGDPDNTSLAGPAAPPRPGPPRQLWSAGLRQAAEFTTWMPPATASAPATCKSESGSPRSAQPISTPKTGERNTKALTRTAE